MDGPSRGPEQALEADYLVVGAGAMGMAFTDSVIAESDARVVIVDRACQPGGHWTTAYPFVRLHQPSAYYGVNSRALGNNTIDRVGWNQGLNELAPVGEVCAYFDAVMQQQFLPTGRVSYFPMSEYLSEGRFRTLAGDEYTVAVKRRVVDATYLQAIVPSMRPAPYSVAPDVDCIAPNELPKFTTRDRYVIVGAGKTGMDVCLWLLRHDIAPEKLTWIMPRDSWLIDRATLQPGPTFIDQFRASYGATLEAIGDATSIEDLFDRLESVGTLLRLDTSIRPRMYRCATVSHLELEQLRRIRDVVRMGHVQRIQPTTIMLDDGSVPTSPSALYIDCTADGAPQRPAKPVFDTDSITLQAVRGCQQVFSAAFIAHVEFAYADDALKNELCAPIPHPDSDLDWMRLTHSDLCNFERWLGDADLTDWLSSARLNLLADLLPPLSHKPRVRERVVSMFQKRLNIAVEQLQTLRSAPTSARPPSANNGKGEAVREESDVDMPLVERPGSGYVYQTGWRLATTDIDEHQRLRLDGVARYIQEVGAAHLADAQLAEVHPHWIVLRTVIDVVEPIELPSDITFRRWCAALSTRWCNMRVQLEGSTGGRVETEGFWICVNKDTLTPARLTDDCIARFGSTTDNHRLKWRPWLTEPIVDGTDTPFPLRRTDIDPFEHVNNTIYWHGVYEILCQVPSLAAPYRAVLEYRSPIKFGETVTIRTERRDDVVRMHFAVGDDVRAAAMVRTIEGVSDNP